MKNLNYVGFKEDKKYFAVKNTSPYTGNVSFYLRDEDNYDLLNNDMVGSWKSIREMEKYFRTSDVKFYKRIYEQEDMKEYSYLGESLEELNSFLDDNEEIVAELLV